MALKFCNRAKAAGQFQIGFRTVDHVATVVRDGLDLVLLQLRHVDGQQRWIHKPQSAKPVQRPHSGIRHRLIDFMCSLVDVHRHRDIHFVGEAADLFQRPVRNGVRCVRRKGGRDQVIVTKAVMHRNALLDVVVGCTRPHGRKIEHDQSDACSYAGFLRDPCGDIREKIHVVETRGAAAQHFGDGQFRAALNEILVDPSGLCGPDMMLQPVHQGDVVRESPEQAHRRMGMRQSRCSGSWRHWSEGSRQCGLHEQRRCALSDRDHPR